MASSSTPSKPYIRGCLLYDFKSGVSGSESTRRINAAFGEGTMSVSTANAWFQRFRAGDESLEDLPRSGRPSDFDEDQLRAVVEADPHLTTREIAAQLGVSQSTIVARLRSIGKVCKLDKWVPHQLSDFDRQRRAEAATSLLSFRRTTGWLDSIVTGDEKWVLYVNEKRRRSWVDADSQPQQQPKPGLHPRKVMLCVWWDVRGVVYYELLPRNTTITAEVYCTQLQKVAEKHKQLRPGHGRVRFLHDNARPHTAKMTRQKLLDLGWEVLPHPAYSPDLAPTDYHLFASLSNALQNQAFVDDDDLDHWLRDFFSSKPEQFYRDGIQSLPQKWQKVIDCDGDYFDD